MCSRHGARRVEPERIPEVREIAPRQRAHSGGKTGDLAQSSYRHRPAAHPLVDALDKSVEAADAVGCASKQMVYEVYGNYVEGLEDDAEEMLDYFGKDFVLPGKSKSPVPFRDSTGDSLLNSAISSGIYQVILERETGFEPATSTLARLHSTTELFPLNESCLITNAACAVKQKYGDLLRRCLSPSFSFFVPQPISRSAPS